MFCMLMNACYETVERLTCRLTAFAALPPLRREMFAAVQRHFLILGQIFFSEMQSKNAKNRDELRQFVFSPVSRAETTLPLRETSLKAFDYFIEAFHFFLQSYIKHTLFICELFAVASESRLKPTFFDLPPIRVLAGGISDAFSVFFSPFFWLLDAFLPLRSSRNRFFRVLIHVRKRRNGRGLRRLSQLLTLVG